MILASLALAAAMMNPSVTSPLTTHVHSDARVSLALINSSTLFRDVVIDGQTYTIPSHGTLSIKAPTGTRIYAAAPGSSYRRGDVMLELSSETPTTITLR